MARWSYDPYPPYVPVAERRRKAEELVRKLAKKGEQLAPVRTSGRKIAVSWWGQAWCRNLERYSDYANRLPRGRSYLSHGAVVDLQIEPGLVRARVLGSELYEVEVKIAELDGKRWKALVAQTSGQFHSMVELLAGRFSDEVMALFVDPKTGLFPKPKDIDLECSCPDWASMCKHVAAVLYGVGVRLDDEPVLLFRLRNVPEEDLIATAASADTYLNQGEDEFTLGEDGLGDLFGIDLASESETESVQPKSTSTRAKGSATRKRTNSTTGSAKTAKTARKKKTTKVEASTRTGKAAKSLPKTAAKTPRKTAAKAAPTPEGKPARKATPSVEKPAKRKQAASTKTRAKKAQTPQKTSTASAKKPSSAATAKAKPRARKKRAS